MDEVWVLIAVLVIVVIIWSVRDRQPTLCRHGWSVGWCPWCHSAEKEDESS